MIYQVTNAPLKNNVKCKLSYVFSVIQSCIALSSVFAVKTKLYVSNVRLEMTAQCVPICVTSLPLEWILIHTKTQGLYPSNTTTYFLPPFKHSYMFR